jgi:citrate synthase
MDAGQGWIGRTEALKRLGVKTQTLYAYVSRGRIAARPDPSDSRRSLYAESDIERLETGDRTAIPTVLSRGATGRGEAEIFSTLSTRIDGRLCYAGLDVAQLSAQATLEDVARRLWGLKSVQPLMGLRPRVDAVTGASIRLKICACLARRAAEDPPLMGRDAEALRAEAADIFNEVIDAAAGSGPRLLFHQRLARGWKLIERDADLIRRALVLCADDLAMPPILAVRATAQAGAPLAGAALAGITALMGSPVMAQTHAAASWVVQARRNPAQALSRALDDTGAVPGFIEPTSPNTDEIRARALIEAARLPPDLDAVWREGEARTGLVPGLPLALALLARRLDLPREGAVDLLMLGRLTGLIGHALDQAIGGSPIRTRLRYVGPTPGAN